MSLQRKILKYVEGKMAKLFFSILTIILFSSSTGHSYIRDYSKAEYLWKSESNKAYISGKVTFEDDTEVINLFVIDFKKKYECTPVFKISFLDSYEYGDSIKTIPIKPGALKLYVDNRLIYDGPIVKSMYSNGTDFGASISPEMLISISNGNIITIELVDKMDIVFSLNKAKTHIDSAQKSCSQD
jgi:hypothetical protein